MEEIAEEHWLRDNTMSDNDRKAYVKGFLACAENMYSEKEVLEMLDQHSEYLETFIYQYIDKNDMEVNEEWFKEFKKK